MSKPEDNELLNTRVASIVAANSIGGSEVDDQYAALSRLIATRILGVKPEDQDVQLDDHDWRLIIDALSHKALILAEQNSTVPAEKRQFWLVELDQYGNPKLVDGAHDDRRGVELAAYLHKSLGLDKGRDLACAEIITTVVNPVDHGANKEALTALNSIGLKP